MVWLASVGEATEMKTQRDPIPPLETILRCLVRPPKAQAFLFTELRPHFALVDPARIVEAAVKGEVIRPLYAEGRPLRKEEDEKQNLFDHFASDVLYWWFNIRNAVTPREQTTYVLKQGHSLREAWADTVTLTHMEASKALLLECLRNDLYPVQMGIAIREFPNFWGDPAGFIPSDEVASWKEEARDAMHEIVHFSKDEKFRREVTKALYNDPNRRVRRDVRYDIRQGNLPDVRAEVKDAWPEDQQKD